MTGDPDGVDSAIRAVAALEEPQRRRLYGFVRDVRRAVTREEAAAAVGISRKLAAFHLEKLVGAGLLKHRSQSHGMPRVGRRPKVYELVDTGVEISIPARRHEVLAEVLVDALLTESAHGSAKAAAHHAAHQRGERLGADVRQRIRPGRLGQERALVIAEQIVAEHGFEPERTGSTCVRLRNCPFQRLAQQAPDLVCGLNHALLTGLIAGLQADTVEAVLRPVDGQCCVELCAATTTGK